MQGLNKQTTYVAVGMLVLGFLLLVLGWNGAAGKDTIVEQFPYLISGGIGGLGLVVGGLAMVVVAQLRLTTAELSARLDALQDALADHRAETAAPTAPTAPAPAAHVEPVEAAPATPRPTRPSRPARPSATRAQAAARRVRD